MNEKKFCFISCVNNKDYYEECLYYINKINVPEDYEIEVLSIEDSKSMASGYNEAMNVSDAKYKIYLHQDTFIINENFLYDILYIFENNSDIGMIGVVGSQTIPQSGSWKHVEHKYGEVYENVNGTLKQIKYRNIKSRYEDVKIIDGFIMITQYDLSWRDDIFDGYYFYDASQSMEFLKGGYRIVIPHQDKPWVIHDCDILNKLEYDKYRKKFLLKYNNTIDNINKYLVNSECKKHNLDNSVLQKYYYDFDKEVFVSKKYKYLQYLDGSEQYIYNVFKSQDKISSYPTELSKYIKDWGSEYHLTHVRTNLLHSIEEVMLKRRKALELGAGMGASTNWLAEKFDVVHCIEGNIDRAKALRERNKCNDNVSIFVDDLNATSFPDENYDLITLLGVMEYLPFYSEEKPEKVCKKIMSKINKNLSDEGIFVLAIENKLGAKYFAGCQEDHNSKIFSGINGYPEKSPITFSKKELSNMLNECGFNNIQFYFPFPDYKLPTTVIRECADIQNYEIGAIVRGNSRVYAGNREYLMMEPLMLESLNKAGILFDMCNSFLIVCSKNSKLNLNTNYQIRKYWNSLFVKERLHHYSDFIKYDDEYYVKKCFLKNNMDKRQDDNDILQMILKDSKMTKGKNVILEIYKSLLINDNYDKFYKYCKRLKKELIDNFSINKSDEEGYELVSGEAFDFVFNNLIEDIDGKWVFIDKKWEANTDFSEDFIMYRAIKNIFFEMHPYIKYFSFNDFAMKFLTKLYNGFDAKRLNKLYKVEATTMTSLYSCSFTVNNLVDNIFSKSIEIKNTVLNQLISEKKVKDVKKLYTPTQICKYNGIYFIVDCWHNRILYTFNWTDNLQEWQIAIKGLAHPHSIAYDGEVFLTEDTERNRLVSFKINNVNRKVEDIEVINIDYMNGRPHYSYYIEELGVFMVWLSMKQTVLFLKRNENGFDVILKQKLVNEDIYIRSCKWIDNKLYVVSGSNYILSYQFNGEKFVLINKYNVLDEIGGMNDMEKIGDYYYLTIYTNKDCKIMPKLIRVKYLEELSSNYEDLSKEVCIKGVPYYINKFNNKIYIPEIDTYSRIVEYSYDNNKIVPIKQLFDYGMPSRQDIENKNKF